METKTRSQLFPDKEYDTLIDELEEGDYELKSELYKVTVFNKVIHISPGNVIKDERLATLYYCYVYVIIKDRVKAKLGVYEKMIEGTNIPEQFDLTEFDEGSMLVFDDYYKEPKRLNDFEIIEQVEAGEDNVFLYLQSKIDPEPSAETIKIHSSSRLTKVYDMIKKNKEKEAEYTKIFEKYSKYFKNLEKFNDEFMEKLESSDLKPLNVMFILCILELYFSVKFIFVDENLMMINDSEIRTMFNTKKYDEVIVLNTVTKNIVEKTEDISQLVLFKEKYKPTLASNKSKAKAKEVEVEDIVEEDIEEAVEPLEDDVEPVLSKTKNKTLLAESKSSEFDTSVETGLAEPSEKPSKISFKGSELKPKVKSSSKESGTPLKTSTFLTGTSHTVKGKKLSGITEETSQDEESSVKPKKSSKPVEPPEEVSVKPKKSSKPVEPPEEVSVKPKKSSKSVEQLPPDVPSVKPTKSSKLVEPLPPDVPSLKPKKSSKSSKPSSTVETRTLTSNEEAYKTKVSEMATLFKKAKTTKGKSTKPESKKNE
uniref:Uncharacterized protein n=1 Tax=viral metagenome TaxID=1070528 RepID=A0A6C0JJ64_9ZZZZ